MTPQMQPRAAYHGCSRCHVYFRNGTALDLQNDPTNPTAVTTNDDGVAIEWTLRAEDQWTLTGLTLVALYLLFVHEPLVGYPSVSIPGQSPEFVRIGAYVFSALWCLYSLMLSPKAWRVGFGKRVRALRLDGTNLQAWTGGREDWTLALENVQSTLIPESPIFRPMGPLNAFPQFLHLPVRLLICDGQYTHKTLWFSRLEDATRADEWLAAQRGEPVQRDHVEKKDSKVADLGTSHDPHLEIAVATVNSKTSTGPNEAERLEQVTETPAAVPLAKDIHWQAPRQLRGIAVAVFFLGMFIMMNAAPMLPSTMQNPPPHLYGLMALGSVVCVLLLAVPPFRRMYHAGKLDIDGYILFCKQPWALRSRFHSFTAIAVPGLPDFSYDLKFRHKSWYIELSEIERYSVSFGQQSALWYHMRPARIDIVRKGFEHPTRTALIGTGEDAERVCEWLNQQLAAASRATEATTSDP
jgi:hypothetical protein